MDIDPESFGRFSEKLARFLGTGTFLFWQTLIVICWITINLVAVNYRWDPYPFILLNLAFSTQAAYAAPLILLAQNRQDDRDRITLEEDRARVAQTKADTEYLARELAALRVAIGELAHVRGFVFQEKKRDGPRDDHHEANGHQRGLEGIFLGQRLDQGWTTCADQRDTDIHNPHRRAPIAPEPVRNHDLVRDGSGKNIAEGV